MILKTAHFEPFMGSWKVICQPTLIGEFYYVPLGWEEELSERNINFEIVDLPTADNA